MYSCQCTNESVEHQTKLVCASRFCLDLPFIMHGAQNVRTNYVIHVACVLMVEVLHEHRMMLCCCRENQGRNQGKRIAFTSKSCTSETIFHFARDVLRVIKNENVHGTRPETIDALFINCMLR